MIPFQSQSFTGGMDLFSNRSSLAKDNPDKYPLLVNGRSRASRITTIAKCIKLTEGLPDASQYSYQGLYSAGPYAVVFAGGRAFSRNYSDESLTSFLNIPGFTMSGAAPQIYMELVPASTINYVRVIDDADDVGGTTTFLGDLIAPSPVAAVIQDGVSQPWVILSNGQARITQNYQQWQNSANGREYVPIGKQMTFSNGKLYIASTDGYQIYQSCSGRPLDFMIVVDVNGDKLSTELEGGAGNVSHKVFADAITCLGRIPTTQDNEGAFYCGSSKQSAIVVPDFSRLIYGEPRFKNRYIASTGAKNHFSFLGDVNGDSTFIDDYGVRSFNAIMTTRNAGKNSPFSLLISPLFSDKISQEVTACGQFNNYSCYAVKTVYGNTVIWFDELRGVWDSIDLYSNVTGQIRQFAEIITPAGTRKLLCLTSDGGVYEMLSQTSTEVETVSFYYGDCSTGDVKVNIDAQFLKAVFENSESDGTVNASIFVDTKKQNSVPFSKTVKKNFTPSASQSLPFGDNSTNNADNVLFQFTDANSGWATGVMLSWNFKTEMTKVGMTCSEVSGPTDNKRMGADYKANKIALGLIPA